MLGAVKAALSRPFYGWYIVAVIFSTSFGRSGFTGVLFGIFLKPMSEEFGWSRSAISGAVTVGTICAALVGITSGRALERYGPRILFPLGGLALALMYFGLASVQMLAMFYLAYAVGRAVAQSVLGESLLSAVVSKWFVRRRGLAVGLARMGTPIAGLILAVVLQAIITAASWRIAWLVLGGIAAALLVLPPLLVLRRTPEDMGLLPDGDLPGTGQRSTRSAVAEVERRDRRSAAAEVSWHLEQARRTVAFWLLITISALGALGATSVNFHMVPHFTDVGVDPVAAAAALGMFGLMMALAMPLWGVLADRIQARPALLCAVAIELAGIAMIIVTRTELMAFASAALYAVGLGGYLTLMAVAWATYFGRRHLGTILGWEVTFRMTGNAFGPLLAALIFDATDSYRVAFSLAFALSVLVAFLVLVAKPPKLGETEIDTAPEPC